MTGNRALSLLVLLSIVVVGCGGSRDDATAPTDSTPTTAQAPSGTDSPSSVDAGRGSELDGFFEDLGETGFNGVVALDVGSEPFVRAFGEADRDAGHPVDERTVFDIGSITKQFTAAAILRLEADGAVSVEDPLASHLPIVTGSLGEVTLHELLTHTAGLPSEVGGDYDETDLPSFVELASDAHDPAQSRYEYSNVGYSLLAAVIEAVSQTTYEEYLRDALFDPAGMESTGYVLPDWSDDVIAVGYVGERAFGRPNEQAWADDGPWWHLRGNGGILSTANDMLAWHRALSGDEILDAEAKAKLFARHVDEGFGDTFYGYGWVNFPTEDGDWIVGHNGGNGVFFADLLRLPDGRAVFVATNVAGTFDDLAFDVAEMIGEAGVVLADVPTCGFPGELPDVGAMPDGVAGDTIGAFVALLGDDDAVARADFVQHHVSPKLAGGRSAAELDTALAALLEELSEGDVTAIRPVSDHHVVVDLETADSVAHLNLSVDSEAPELLACIELAIDEQQ